MTPEQQKLIEQARLYAEHDEYVVTRTYIRGLLEIIEQQAANVPDVWVATLSDLCSFAVNAVSKMRSAGAPLGFLKDDIDRLLPAAHKLLAAAPEYKPICGASGDSGATLCQQCGQRRHSGMCAGSPSIDLGRYAGTYGGYRKAGER